MAATTTHTDEHAGRNHEPCCWQAFENAERTVHAARQVITDARQATDVFAAGTAEKVRRHPLAAVGVAAAAGIVIGGLVVAVGVLARRRA